MALVVLLLNAFILCHFNMELLIKITWKIKTLTHNFFFSLISFRLLMPSLSQDLLMSCLWRQNGVTLAFISFYLIWKILLNFCCQLQSVTLTLLIHSMVVRSWEEPKAQWRRKHWRWNEIKLPVVLSQQRCKPRLLVRTQPKEIMLSNS